VFVFVCVRVCVIGRKIRKCVCVCDGYELLFSMLCLISLSLSLSHSLSLISLCHLSDGGHVSANVSLLCDAMDVDDMGITGPDVI